ncbi:MAG: GTPase [Candidatus Helarchaeota archaeon]
MEKFWDVIYQNIRLADIIIEVLDARNPMGTRNRHVENYAIKLNKKLILVLNKADLVPKSVIMKWKEKLKSDFKVFYLIGTKKYSESMQIFKKYLYKIAKNKDVKILILGYPNVGKSSIINSLKMKDSVQTSPEAGHTRGKQFIRLKGNIMLIDSPGVYPVADDDEVELALKNARRVEKISDLELVVSKIMDLVGSKKISHLYEIDFLNVTDFLEKFARKTGKLLKGNKPNIEEAARIFIRDFQRNKIPYYVDPFQ